MMLVNNKNIEEADRLRKLALLVEQTELNEDQLLSINSSTSQIEKDIESSPNFRHARHRVGAISAIIVLLVMAIIVYIAIYLENNYGINANVIIVIAYIFGNIILLYSPTPDQQTDKILKSENWFLKKLFIPKQH